MEVARICRVFAQPVMIGWVTMTRGLVKFSVPQGDELCYGVAIIQRRWMGRSETQFVIEMR